MQFLDSTVVCVGSVFATVRDYFDFLRDTKSSQWLSSYFFSANICGLGIQEKKGCFCFQDSQSQDLLVCSCLSQPLSIPVSGRIESPCS